MAITGSLGSYHKPHKYDNLHKTPHLVDVFQTAGSGTTGGALYVVGSASASDVYHITYLAVSITNPTAAAAVSVYGATTEIAQLPTGTAGYWDFSFGEIGLVVGTTTTATVSIVLSGGTSTVKFYCQGYKDI